MNGPLYTNKTRFFMLNKKSYFCNKDSGRLSIPKDLFNGNMVLRYSEASYRSQVMEPFKRFKMIDISI